MSIGIQKEIGTNRILVWLLVISLVFGSHSFVVSASQATSYYVDSVNGSDANSGTVESSPWKSLAPIHARTLLPGDMVFLKSGSTWNGGLIIDDSGVEGNPITFTTYGTGQRPIIRNPGSDADWTTAVTINADWVVLDGIMARDAQWRGVSIANGADHNVVQNVEATNVGIGVGVYGQWNLVTRNYIHDLHLVRNTPGGDDDFGAVAIWLFNSNNEVSYNTMIDCSGPSYDYGSDGGCVEVYAGSNDSNNLHIHHNYCEESNGFMEIGGRGYQVHDVTLAYNVSVDNNRDQFLGAHLGGYFGIDLQNLAIDNNTIVLHSSPDGRLWAVIAFFYGEPTAQQVAMRNNLFYLDDCDSVVGHAGEITEYNNLVYDLEGNYNLGFVPDASDIIGRDPEFIDAGSYGMAGIYSLLGASPAIDAGANLGYTIDSAGKTVPSGQLPDIGAYEYGASAATPTSAPTSAPTSTPTSTPTKTVTPIATSTPTRTATLTQTGSPVPPTATAAVQPIGTVTSLPTATPLPVPTNTPTSSAGVLSGLSWEAEAGVLSAPFRVRSGYVYQSSATHDPLAGGKATYRFLVEQAGDYVVYGDVWAPNSSANSFFVGMDTEPMTAMIWDLTTNSGFGSQVVSWRGNGTEGNNQFDPKVFTLSAGVHELIVRGREAQARIDRLWVEALDSTTAARTPTLLPPSTAPPTRTSTPPATLVPGVTPNPSLAVIPTGTPVVMGTPPAFKYRLHLPLVLAP
jgi:hypothetical protein